VGNDDDEALKSPFMAVTPVSSRDDAAEALLASLDAHQALISSALDPKARARLGQYLTPARIAQFMAGMLTFDGPVRLLDAGAGAGALSTAAFAAANGSGFDIDIEAWEVDPDMAAHLANTFGQLSARVTIRKDDFIKAGVLEHVSGNPKRFTHALLNPPYKKIASNSQHRHLLRAVRIETVNLYSAFVALSVLLLRDGGECVAIIPRSFCNGPYYKPFRDLILNQCAIERIHLFESRTDAFKTDDVLQENVIIKLKKRGHQGGVMVTYSQNANLADYKETWADFGQIVAPHDDERFIHIPTPDLVPKSTTYSATLKELGLTVSTGPVVDFRVREYWLSHPEKDSAPLLYPHHFSGGRLEYPREHKKPNALSLTQAVKKWLLPAGTYVVTKRFTSKEEKRRLVAYVVNPTDLQADWWGFENHLNVIHVDKHGLAKSLALGLAAYLNSTFAETAFRSFSGHTQVNATDLRNLRYPDQAVLEAAGQIALEHPELTSDDILIQAQRNVNKAAN
jgi:adenine-specific DNA-methyltransferase